jgi:formylglycine-generating enzyme required for sulfatase activity
MPLLIMNRQVSAKDYGLCEAEGVCRPLGRPSANADVPVTGVSFSDALDYAAWLSRKSGTTYRLPTDAEWAFAAKERFYGDPLGDGATQANPAANQVSRYLAAAVLTAPDPVVHPAGHFGANANGLLDLSGNVWEWTSTCYQRARLEADGLAIASSNENCGVRVLEGRHRAYLSYFLGDAKGGGCSIGTAPDHLGFRLVQEAGMLDFVKHWFARQWSALAN